MYYVYYLYYLYHLYFLYHLYHLNDLIYENLKNGKLLTDSLTQWQLTANIDYLKLKINWCIIVIVADPVINVFSEDLKMVNHSLTNNFESRDASASKNIQTTKGRHPEKMLLFFWILSKWGGGACPVFVTFS